MLDKEKLWLGIYVYCPQDMYEKERNQIMMEVAENFRGIADESVKCIVMPKETEEKIATIEIECIYDPKNYHEEYDEFFKKAESYIANFKTVFGNITQEESDKE